MPEPAGGKSTEMENDFGAFSVSASSLAMSDDDDDKTCRCGDGETKADTWVNEKHQHTRKSENAECRLMFDETIAMIIDLHREDLCFILCKDRLLESL